MPSCSRPKTRRKQNNALEGFRPRIVAAAKQSSKIVEELKINAGLADEQTLLKRRQDDVVAVFARLDDKQVKFSQDLPKLNQDMQQLAKGMAEWEAEVKRIGPIAAKRQEYAA